MSANGTLVRETDSFRVLINATGRYALWPAHRTLPPGWRESLSPRSKAECLAHVRRVWTDLEVRSQAPTKKSPGVEFGLMFFGGGEHALAGEKYLMLIECARYADQHGFSSVWRLWRGESIRTLTGDGTEREIRAYPTPVQPELPLWITAAESPATFQQAGELGADLLTHLFDLRVDKLAAMIALYREARERSGFDPETGRVAVALHTFLADDVAEVRRHAQKPYGAYLKANARLV